MIEDLGRSATRSPGLNGWFFIFSLKSVEVIHEYFVQLFWSQKIEKVVLRVSFVVPLKGQRAGVFVINDRKAVITGGFHGSSRLREFKPATNCGLTNAKLSGNGFVGQTALMQASAFLYLLLPVLMLKLLDS